MKNNVLALFLLLFLCSIGHFSSAQKLPTGPQVLTFFSDLDDTEQPYGLYLPKKFSEKKRYPLVVMLHGAGSNHRLALRRVFGKSNATGETDVEATRAFPEWADVDYIVATPYARGTAGYRGICEKDVMDMLADVKRRFKIDENRVYLTGLSMGGGGTLWLGLSRPDLWAAIAPVCPAPPLRTDELAPNAGNMAVHFFHGDKDPVVPVSISRDWVKRLKELGTPTVEYKEFPEVLHDSWVGAYDNEFIFKWFGQFERNPTPDRVRHVSFDFEHGKAYWVRFDALTAGTAASIDARFANQNDLSITTSELAGFTLTLAGHPKFKASKPLIVHIDGQSVDAVPTAAGVVSFSKKGAAWSATPYKSEYALAKRLGEEGPIEAAFAGRHIYVYGTADSPAPEVLKARLDSASRAADWSVDRGWFLGRVKFYPRVVADKDLRPSDLESSNLILFGTKETNSVIAQFASQLPMHLDPKATAEYGLFYVYPVNGRYVAMSSGLPWWSGADVKGWRFMPPVQHALIGQKDFKLFKGAAKNPLVEGYFDKNWFLSEADGKAIMDSGVIFFN